jgi:pyruvate/2-oxoglutarate dehydrogenase complex dihydrolipoamide acyltransferase (E2) component
MLSVAGFSARISMEQQRTPVLVPKMGQGMEDATIVRWIQESGASVRAGEPILEIETDKANFVLKSPIDGKLVVDSKPGDVIPVNGTVGWIEG